MIDHFNKQFVIPVIREQDEKDLENICEALSDGGLSVLEVTLMSEAAYRVIEKISKKSQLIVGAGTVLSDIQAQKAIDCGAQFLVSPGLNTNAVEVAQKNKMLFIPGVMTPTEVTAALDLGCEALKVFPISSLGGTQYIKMLKGPFPNANWMATGGVSAQDIPAYLGAGVSCIGIGTQLTPAELIKNKDWNMLKRLAEEHVQAVRQARAK